MPASGYCSGRKVTHNLARAFVDILEEFGISNKVSFTLRRRQRAAYHPQILSITCDNASANDTMIDSLADIFDDFPSLPNWMRCFAYTLNLVAKCIMKQFDIPKKSKHQADGWDIAFNALDALADELEGDSDEDEADENDNGEIEEGTFDGREGMTAEEVRNLKKTVEPVQRALVKVCLLTHLAKNN